MLTVADLLTGQGIHLRSVSLGYCAVEAWQVYGIFLSGMVIGFMLGAAIVKILHEFRR
jgi:hypothetical protein